MPCLTTTIPQTARAYLSALIYGMAVLAAGGATRGELKGVADVAFRHWSQEKRAAGALRLH